MIRHYIAIFYRNFLKNKLVSIVSLISLSISFSISLVLLNYYNYHKTFDNYNDEDTSTLRVYHIDKNNNVSGEGSLLTYAALGNLSKENIPNILDFGRLYQWNEAVLSYEDNRFAQPVFYGDRSLFDIFPFEFLNGEVGENFDQPNKIILSRSVSEKYFGDINAIGKTLVLKDWFQEVVLEVVGIYEDMPDKMHVDIDILISFSSLNVNPIWRGLVDNNWEADSFYTYLLVNKKANVNNLVTQINNIALDYLPESTRSSILFGLQPVQDIHLNSNLRYEINQNADKRMINFFMLIGILIVAIAVINLINFFTSNVVERAKEVGIKKALGVGMKKLRLQFLTEFMLFNTIALLMGVLFFLLLIKSKYVGILETPGQTFDYSFWILILIIFCAGLILTGIYPAIVMSSFKLHNKKNKDSGDLVRKSLMIFQYFVSVGLLYGVTVIYAQFEYLAEKDLGFEKEDVLVVKAPSVIRNDSLFAASIDLVKNKLAQFHSVSAVSGSSGVPGAGFDAELEISKIDAQEEIIKIRTFVHTDYNFNEIYKLKLLAGRYFDQSFVSDKTDAVIINKVLFDQLGFVNLEEAIGQKVIFAREVKTIIGVVSNFHLENLKKLHKPVVFGMPQHSSLIHYFSMSINKALLTETTEFINDFYRSEFSVDAEYFYIEDYFNDNYGKDIGFYELFQILTFITILLTVFGLIGLSFYYSSKKHKEIAIRKVFGADSLHIFIILFRYFFYLILIGSLIALPVFYFGVNKWLEQYAYRVEHSWLYFVIPLITIIFITLVTTGVTLFKASVQNPVIALKEN